MNSIRTLFFSLIVTSIISCNTKSKQIKTPGSDMETIKAETSLKNALTFFSSFDNGTDAIFAKGDKHLYSVTNRKNRDSARFGLHKKGVTIAKNKGRFGDALSYSEKSNGYIFYKSQNNINYSEKSWEGAISFWVSLDPNLDLKPGYCDPIQITDSGYNDAGFWVDFTKENPRDFRLGVIGDRDSWNPNPEGPDNENPIFIKQLVVVDNPPFKRNLWTHIVINFKNLNTANGMATIYVNGEQKGLRSNIKDPFTWEIENSKIYLGLGYIGLMDEVSIYNKYLTKDEVKRLYNLENGVQSLLKKEGDK